MEQWNEWRGNGRNEWKNVKEGNGRNEEERKEEWREGGAELKVEGMDRDRGNGGRGEVRESATANRILSNRLLPTANRPLLTETCRSKTQRRDLLCIQLHRLRVRTGALRASPEGDSRSG